jgi:hypothetical protein
MSVTVGTWSSLAEWVTFLPDPHEFATSFVNWVEDNPNKRGDIFVVFEALNYWNVCETLEGFTG